MRPCPRKPFLLALAALVSGCAPPRSAIDASRPTASAPTNAAETAANLAETAARAPGPAAILRPTGEPTLIPLPPGKDKGRFPEAPYPPLPAVFETRGPVVEPLRAIAAEAARKKRARVVGVALIDLSRGRAYGVNAHRVFRPASVIKLSVMVAAYEAARDGMPRAEFQRLRPDIRQMIIVSDNPATRRLVHRLGKARVNRSMAALGVPGLALAEQTRGNLVLVGSRATAAETALLLARLARREVVSPEASEAMLELLGEQQRRNRIPAGTFAARARRGDASRTGIWIGNKTGTLAGLVHDAGIVLEPDAGLAYVLALYTEGASSEAAGVQLCATLAARVYDLMAGAPTSRPAVSRRP